MSEVAISVKHLSKIYKLYDNPIDRLKESLHPFGKRYHKPFHALNNVSFNINKGETVGIIGGNGAGKSTLLKLITGVLTPSSGSLEVNGRIASLLELGAGFNPDYTGLENIYFQGELMGFTRKDIESKLADILSFADIGDFVYQPVKMYSSGMFARLAFAVSINVAPDVLIVDEALSVGDELFQRKCFSRIESMRNSGVTVLFVSHSGSQIVELCDKAIIMDAGEKLAIGDPKQIVARYQKLLYAPAHKRADVRLQIQRAFHEDLDSVSDMPLEATQGHASDTHSVHEQLSDSFDAGLVPQSTLSYESQGALIHDVVILNLAGERVNQLVNGKSYTYAYKVKFSENAYNVRFGMLIKTLNGIELGGGVSASNTAYSVAFVPKESLYQVEFRFDCRLNTGFYFMNAGVVAEINGSETFLHRLFDAAMFKVQAQALNTSTGIVDFACFAQLTQIES